MKTFAATMPEDQIAAFCRRWKISQLELFGSILRDDFNDSSDVDMLVTFSEDAGWSLLDHVQMEAELEELLGREVDLISRRAVEQSHNWIRRQEILGAAQVIHTKPGIIHAQG
ncbi:MAG: nucleotidyltransferase family protein [Caldilineaceae bacterium]|nr:nucleotidyltransferase family protein [Caldilineaceae bacterium]